MLSQELPTTKMNVIEKTKYNYEKFNQKRKREVKKERKREEEKEEGTREGEKENNSIYVLSHTTKDYGFCKYKNMYDDFTP